MKVSDLRSRLDAIKKRDTQDIPGNNRKPDEKSSGIFNPADKKGTESSGLERVSGENTKDRDEAFGNSDSCTAGSSLPASEKALLENGWKKLSDMVYEKITMCDNPLPENISDFLMIQPAESGRLVFYDTETTGLSGGAGNIVFLIGFGFPEGEKFKTVQLMLTDFPGEPVFLEELGKYLSPDKIYVSYNGKSFDSNLLKSRFAMNGMRLEFGYQLDLLYPARRLWKNIIGSCSLSDIEGKILKKGRTLDVPGAFIPDLYFDFMRNGKYSTIEGVAAHHLEDILSLAQLLNLFEKIYHNPEEYNGADRLGLSSLLIARHPDEAVEVLKKGMAEGSFFCGRELGLYYRKSGRYLESSEVWRSLWSDGRSVFAGVELAKYYEHREKDIEKAYRITEEILSLEQFRIKLFKADIEKRKARLKNKLENKSQ